MAKISNYKIKRHKRVYQGSTIKRFGMMRTIGGIALLCILFFVGYSVAEPVMSFFSGNMRTRVEDEYASSSQPQESKPPSSSDTTDNMGGVIGFDEIRAAFMPCTTLADDDRFNEFVSQAKSLGVNTAVIEVKDAGGVIYYDSHVTEAHEIGAVLEETPDLAARIETLSGQGIQTIVRLRTFGDPLAARKIKGAAARYSKDITSIWLDNYAEEGGKPWINPESTEGMGYISALVTEAAECGAAYVMADALHYPMGVGLNLAYFGPKSNDSRAAVLNSCIAQLETVLADTDCGLIVSYEADAYLSKSEMIYGGDPADIAAQCIAPVVLPADFDSDITIGKTRITDPTAQTYDVTHAFGEYLLADVAADTQVLPMIAYDSEQIRALGTLGISPYALYAADGLYE